MVETIPEQTILVIVVGVDHQLSGFEQDVGRVAAVHGRRPHTGRVAAVWREIRGEIAPVRLHLCRERRFGRRPLIALKRRRTKHKRQFAAVTRLLIAIGVVGAPRALAKAEWVVETIEPRLTVVVFGELLRGEARRALEHIVGDHTRRQQIVIARVRRRRRIVIQHAVQWTKQRTHQQIVSTNEEGRKSAKQNCFKQSKI